MEFLHAVLAALVIQASFLTVSGQDNELSPKLRDVKVVIKDAAGTAIQTLLGAYPKPILANPQVPQSGSLEVTLAIEKSGQPFKPQQVMLLLQSVSLKLTAYAVAKTKGGSHVLSINTDAVEKQLGKLPGEYEVSLVVGDTSVNGLIYRMGNVELLFKYGSTAPEPAAMVRTAAFQPVDNIKPEIFHQFRPREQRPPATISYGFSALALVPLLAVVLYVPKIAGFNFKGFSVAPLYSLLFHGGLAAMLLLYLVFWLHLNLAQTLPLAGLCGLFVAGSGYLLLSALSTNRLKKAD